MNQISSLNLPTPHVPEDDENTPVAPVPHTVVNLSHSNAPIIYLQAPSDTNLVEGEASKRKEKEIKEN